MTILVAKQMSGLMDIANLAIELVEAESDALAAKEALTASYNHYKHQNGIEHITRDTPQWDLMMVVTKPEFAASEKARRRAYNLKRKLRNAVARYQGDIENILREGGAA